MTQSQVALRLNQQQRELLDRTVAEQSSPGRSELIARALDEYHAAHFAEEV
jgi:hypothetical protein